MSTTINTPAGATSPPAEVIDSGSAGAPRARHEGQRGIRGWSGRFRPRHLRAILLSVCAGGSVLLYLVLLAIVPNLGPAERSFVGEGLPWADGLLAGTLLETRDLIERPAYAALHTAGSAAYLLVLLGLFVLYGVALATVAGRWSRAQAWIGGGAGAAFLVVTALSPATLSSDVFSYIMYGRMFALYGADPYAILPYQYPEDPFLPLVYWQEVPSFYGPLWTLASGGLALLGGDRIGLTVLLFRAGAVLAALASGALIWACLVRVAPQRATQGLIFFLWNPLVVIESGLSAHNDVVMAALLLLACWLHLERRRAAAVVALTLSALLKYVTAPLLPLYVLLALRRLPGLRQRAKFVVAAALAATLTVGAVFGLARVGPEALAVGALGAGLDRYQNNVHELAFDRLRSAHGQEAEWEGVPVQFEPWWAMTHAATDLWSMAPEAEAPVVRLAQWTTCLVLAPQEGAWLRVYVAATGQIGFIQAGDIGPLATEPEVISEEAARLEAGPAGSRAVRLANATLRLGGWLAFGLVWLAAAWRADHLRALLGWSLAVLLAFYWLASAWIWPWYVIWALALAALLPGSWLAGLTGVLSATVLTLYVAHGYQNTTAEWIYEYRSIAAFVLPLVLFGTGVGVWWVCRGVVGLARAAHGLVRGRVGVRAG